MPLICAILPGTASIRRTGTTISVFVSFVPVHLPENLMFSGVPTVHQTPLHFAASFLYSFIKRR